MHCKKYNNRYLSYYSKVYQVKKCKLHQISTSLSFKLSSVAGKIYRVDSDVIAVLEKGNEIRSFNRIKHRTCSSLNGKYITFKDVDVYYVDRCKRRKLENWQVYLDHSTKKNSRYKPILSLTEKEFFDIEIGKNIDENEDKKNKAAQRISSKLDDSNIDVIPLKEACRGLNGKYVSFYSLIYKIENCRKRLVTSNQLLKMNQSGNIRVKELTSEQWLSIPLKEEAVKKQETQNKMQSEQIYRAH